MREWVFFCLMKNFVNNQNEVLKLNDQILILYLIFEFAEKKYIQLLFKFNLRQN